MAEKSQSSCLDALLTDGNGGQTILRAASSASDSAPVPAPALRPRDFADEVTEIFHKAKRAALAGAS